MANDRKDQTPSRAIKVLQVEDVPIDAELVLRHLKRHGIAFESKRVSTEFGLREALAAFVPDVILSDYSLPEFDGLRALGLTRQLAPGTPFIFVTGSIRPGDATDALGNGACGFLIKDDLRELGSTIEKALMNRAGDKS